MLTLIKNCELYSPEYVGEKDILMAGDRILKIATDIPDLDGDFFQVRTIDARNLLAVPGFIDSHVHLIGGGGEGGFRTRTPEIQLSELTRAGITTVVGCLGTDGTTRHMTDLLAKARGLEEEGVTTYIYTGSYQMPPVSILNSCRDDIIIIEKVIGIGEIAVADHRSSQPTLDEFKKIAAQARTGGLLSGKAGIINVHLGDEEQGLELLIKTCQDTAIPATQFLPTHLNRNKKLLNNARTFVEFGGRVDLTTSTSSLKGEIGYGAAEAARILLESGISSESITFSSDGMGSLPLFNEQGEFAGLGIGSVESLFAEIRQAVQNEGIKFEDALKFITSNIASHLGLKKRGQIREGYYADLVLIDKEMEIRTIIANGRIMIEDGEVIVKGTFE